AYISSSSTGNDAAVVLSPCTGQNVLNIRGGIISNQSKLKYLQGDTGLRADKKIPAGGKRSCPAGGFRNAQTDNVSGLCATALNFYRTDGRWFPYTHKT
ncbi:hypothetical protein AIT79_004637, partial [Salmonella enterica subsp. diarizonae]